MINLTYIYGSEICVTPQPRKSRRLYTGFPGAHGATAMNMGSQGRIIKITGVLRASGATYVIARGYLQAMINNIEALKDALPGIYAYGSDVYYNTVFENPITLVTQNNKAFHHSSGQVVVEFFASLRTLI